MIWEPILPTDWSRPTSWTLGRISDRRVIQFWDPEHLLAQELKRQLLANPAEREPDCCERKGQFWDMAALYPKQARWAGSLPSPVLLNGPVAGIRAELESELSTLLVSPR